MAIGPKMTRVGDEVCVLFGERAPFVLRPMHDHLVFAGDTFLNGDDFMWGKITENVKSNRRPDIPNVTFELRLCESFAF
jgi:hypothetical protein